MAIHESMASVTFDNQVSVMGNLGFGSEKYGIDLVIGNEVESNAWHALVELESDCILLEVKAGLFDTNQPKDFAWWGPEECSDEADDYLKSLIKRISE